MPFQIKVGDRTYLTDDLTLDEAIAIEEATGHSWREINPLRSAKDCKAILDAFRARLGEGDPAGAITLRNAIDLVSYVSDDLPTLYEDGVPKAEAASPTDGSSSVLVGSDGHPT